MKYLLVAINAKYIHSNPAIYSLRAYAGEEYRENIELAEYTINQYLPEILSDIYLRKPDAIGISCYIWNWKMVSELIVEIKKVLPDVDIWLGGPEVTYHPELVINKFPELKGIMVGEGEITFKKMLEMYVSGKTSHEDWRNLKGLYLADGYTGIQDPMDVSDLPFLYYNMESFENKIIYYETSRGCPYRCSYCLSSIADSSAGGEEKCKPAPKRVRFRDMDTVKKELQFFLDNKVKQVKFVDRTFNCNHEHAMEIWRYIYEHDNGITNFHFEISADILREEEIELLNKLRPGLAQLEIGVQSTNPETIKAINRVMDVEKLEKIVSKINQGNNIHQHLDLIAGLPYEDLESFKKSFNRVYAMKPEQLQLGFLKVLKGSEMEARAEEFGILYMSNPPYEVLSTKWLSYKDVLKLKRIEEMVELYYNSNQYTHTIPFLLNNFDSPYQMYEGLADFYEKNGLFLNSPSRAYKYEVLFNFACQVDGEHEKVYRQLLTFDIYLRENAKSRPSFACEMDEKQKEHIRDYYRNEEESRKDLPGYENFDAKQLQKMTHMEKFDYPLWDKEAMDAVYAGTNKGRECYIIFDYMQRNPLNYESRYLCKY